MYTFPLHRCELLRRQTFC